MGLAVVIVVIDWEQRVRQRRLVEAVVDTGAGDQAEPEAEAT